MLNTWIITISKVNISTGKNYVTKRVMKTKKTSATAWKNDHAIHIFFISSHIHIFSFNKEIIEKNVYLLFAFLNNVKKSQFSTRNIRHVRSYLYIFSVTKRKFLHYSDTVSHVT